MDKLPGQPLAPRQSDSLTAWAGLYFQIHVVGAPEKTERAKCTDLSKFLSFYQSESSLGHDRVDPWTPTVTRSFQRALRPSRGLVAASPRCVHRHSPFAEPDSSEGVASLEAGVSAGTADH